MNEIFFPSQYKKVLLSKTKNSTIRIGNEMGKYKAGKTYIAKSYAGRAWNIKIKITNIFKTNLNKLSELGISGQSIKATQKKEKLPFNSKVELIRFRII